MIKLKNILEKPEIKGFWLQYCTHSKKLDGFWEIYNSDLTWAFTTNCNEKIYGILDMFPVSYKDEVHLRELMQKGNEKIYDSYYKNSNVVIYTSYWHITDCSVPNSSKYRILL